MWDNTVITNAGVELIKNTMSGETIVITAVKSGTGKVSVDVLAKQTEVVDESRMEQFSRLRTKEMRYLYQYFLKIQVLQRDTQ